MTFHVDTVTTVELVIGRYLNAVRLYNERTGDELRLHFATRAKLIEVRNELNTLLTFYPAPRSLAPEGGGEGGLGVSTS